jgi:hypothetical protein
MESENRNRHPYKVRIYYSPAGIHDGNNYHVFFNLPWLYPNRSIRIHYLLDPGESGRQRYSQW